MKKIIFIVLATIMMVGCVDQKYVATSVEEGDFATIEYDGCEYLLRISYGKGYLAHKGNCKYCQQRLRQMMWEVQDSILNTMD